MSQLQQDFAVNQSSLQALRAEQNPLAGSPLFERAQQEFRADRQKLQALGLRTEAPTASEYNPISNGIAASNREVVAVPGFAGGMFDPRTGERLDRPNAPVIPGFQNGTLFQQQTDGSYQRIDNLPEPEVIYARPTTIDFMRYLTVSEVPYRSLPVGVRIPPLPSGLEVV